VITSCQLVAYDEKNKEVDAIDLLLTNSKGKKEKQILKSGAHFNVHTYKFSIVSTEALNKSYIELNELERFSLHRATLPSVEHEQSTIDFDRPVVTSTTESYCYQSDGIRSRGFLRFNIGIYQFSLNIENVTGNMVSNPLKLLRNEERLLDDTELKYMYDKVLESEFFNIFLDGLRGNTKVDLTEDAVESSAFWLRRFLTKKFLAEISRLISKQERLIQNAQELSEVSQFNHATDLRGQDIEWLAQHPESLDEVDFGSFEFDRRSYQINLVQQSKTDIHYDNFENRLILSCLQSMTEYFETEALSSENGLWFLEHLSADISAEVNDRMFELAQLFKLTPPFTEIPSFSHSFFDDPFYAQVFEYIANWYDIKDFKSGSQFHAPVPEITKTWEYYCIAEITNAFLGDGFLVTDATYSTMGKLKSYILVRGVEESIEIYYEPSISNESVDMPITSTSPNKGLPDFLLHYRSGETQSVGIVDAKFTGPEQIVKWSKEIYQKYGLYFCKNDGQAIDYVVSLYPEQPKKEGLKNHRRGPHAERVLPYLGIMSLPISEISVGNFYEDLKSLVGM